MSCEGFEKSITFHFCPFGQLSFGCQVWNRMHNHAENAIASNYDGINLKWFCIGWWKMIVPRVFFVTIVSIIDETLPNIVHNWYLNIVSIEYQYVIFSWGEGGQLFFQNVKNEFFWGFFYHQILWFLKNQQKFYIMFH